MLLALLMLLLGPAAPEGAPVPVYDGVVAGEDILAAAREWWRGETSVEAVRPQDVIRARGGRVLLLPPEVDPATVSGRIRLALVEEVGGHRRHLRWITLIVRRYADVLVAGRRLDLHETAEDVRVERREITLLGAGLVADRAWLQGKRTRRMVAEGSVLFESMFEPEPLVLHGEQVTLRVRAPGVTLSVAAVARQDGALGDAISVQKAGSAERLTATVAGPHTVEIIVR